MKRWLCSIGIGVLGVAAVFAQALGNPRGFPVRGEISSSTRVVGGLTVEMTGDGMGTTEAANVNADGTFEFRSVSSGAHQLRVIGSGGAVLYQDTVFISSANQPLSIRLADPPNASRSADSTISLRQLNHKIPPAAQKAYAKGEQAAARKNHLQAAEAFREAIAIDPELVDAYNELGASEVALGDLPHAAEHFQKAIDLVPEHPLALPNLSIVLAKMRRFHDAGATARRALKVAPGSCQVHYILALSLLMENGDSDEALDHLQRSAAEVPKAHLVIADLLSERGQRQEAVRHLQDYLHDASPSDAERTKVEARIAQLQQ